MRSATRTIPFDRQYVVTNLYRLAASPPVRMTGDQRREHILELMRMRALAIAMADDPAIGGALRSAMFHHSATTAGVMRQAPEKGDIRTDVDPEMIGWISVAISLLATYRSALESDEGMRDTARVMSALLTLVSVEDPLP